MTTSARLLRRHGWTVVGVAAFVLVIVLGVASRPQAVVGTLPTPEGWALRSDPGGAVTYAVPPRWETVASASSGPGVVSLDAALRPDQATYENSVVPLLLEPGAGPAVSVLANARLADELGIEPGQPLDEAVESVARWANRGWTSLFIEQGCVDTAGQPFVGVGLRGLAWDFLGCHGTSGSVRTFVAVDNAHSVVVIGFLLARTDADRGDLDTILGSLRVHGAALDQADHEHGEQDRDGEHLPSEA